MYETKNIEKQLVKYSKLSAQEIINQLEEEENTWRGDEVLHDDITILVFKIKN